jgi:hypothetical protein
MPKKLLVLGGGSGGLIISREVRGQLSPNEVEITAVDARDRTEFRPSYLYVAFGYRWPEQISAPFEHLKKYGINFVKARLTKIDPANRWVSTTAGDLTYDDLVVSLGAETVETGFPHTWELEPSLKVAETLSQVRQGHVVVGVHSLPYRCPPAPIEPAMLTHFYYLTRGLRDKVKITVVHPLKRPEGARGVYVFHDGGRYFRGAYAVPVEDPMGAGDAMAGYFTALYLSGTPPETALNLAEAASTLVVTVRGDNEAVPTPAEAERLLLSP